MLSDPERRQTYDRFGHEGLRVEGFEPGRVLREPPGHLRCDLRRRRRPSAVSGREPSAGADIGAVVEIGLEDVLDDQKREISFEAVSVVRALPGKRRRARHADRDLPQVRGTGQLREVSRSIFGQVVRAMPCDAAAATAGSRRPHASSAAGRGA